MKRLITKIKENKSFILPWVVLAISVLIFASGLTYAYFDLVTGGGTTSSLKTLATDFDVSLIGGSTINVSNMLPIYDRYRSTQATNYNFSLQNNSRKLDSCYSLSLEFSSITYNLISEGLKWELLNNTNGTSTIGNFSETIDNKLLLVTNQQIDANDSQSLTLRIWASADGNANQSSIMNGSLAANISLIAIGNSCRQRISQTYENMSDTYQTFTSNVSGSYIVKLWGAEGNSSSYKGSYTEGVISLNKGEKLYVYVGKGLSTKINSEAFNAGTSSNDLYPGGGATDVRLVGGTWNNVESLNSRIMVAAGAGALGAAGGGLTGYNGAVATGGTQTAGGNGSGATNGTFGIGGNGSGGGGGYYGGGGSLSGASGSGSSYISGHAGCIAIGESGSGTYRNGCTSSSTTVNCSKHYSEKYFTDTVMIDGNGYSWTTTKGQYVGLPTYVPSINAPSTGSGHAEIILAPVTVSLILGGGTTTQVFESSGYEYGDTIILENPIRSEYTFDGWVLTSGDAILNNNYLTFGGKNVVLTAKWVVNNVSLSLSLNGGHASQIFDDSYREGTEISLLDPMKYGNLFTGWTINKESSILSNDILTIGSEDLVLTANWIAYENMYTYSGTSEVLNDGYGNWRIKFLTSGTFTPLIDMEIDIFLVGGGGGGGGAGSTDWNGAGGGGGGFTNTITSQQLISNNTYEVVIGEGGVAGNRGTGGIGSESSFDIIETIYTAAGGTGGGSYNGYMMGGNGGSGGGGDGKVGSSYGSGGEGTIIWATNGTGQGTSTGISTCEFGMGTLTGCSSGIAGYPNGEVTPYASGGSGYGNATTPVVGSCGVAGCVTTPNTGSGGGGVGYYGGQGADGAGASGIVIIRNARAES